MFENKSYREMGKGSLAPFSNLFRANLLLQQGGWWIDMDVVCLQPWKLEQQDLVASSAEWKFGTLANCNVLRASPGAAWIENWIHQLETRYAEKMFHGDGPRTLQKMIRELNAQHLIVPPDTFNPINWRYARYLVRPQESVFHPRRIKRILGITQPVGRITSRSLGVHLWSEIWNFEKLDRDGSHHPASIYEQLKKRYGVQPLPRTEAPAADANA
jgi:hypothetical protein